MASYRAVNAVLIALENFFKQRMPEALSSGPTNARVELLGSADLSDPLTGNVLAIYAHHIGIDPHGRSRHFAPKGTDQNKGMAAELPINLHLLLIASATSASIEADLMAWAMMAIANESQMNISHFLETDPEWSQRELLTITPENINTDDLMRMWDVFELKYTSSVPYVVRTIRLRLNPEKTQGPAVTTRVFPTGVAEH